MVERLLRRRRGRVRFPAWAAGCPARTGAPRRCRSRTLRVELGQLVLVDVAGRRAARARSASTGSCSRYHCSCSPDDARSRPSAIEMSVGPVGSVRPERLGAGEARGGHVDEVRPLARAGVRDRPADHVVHRLHVAPVDRLDRDPERLAGFRSGRRPRTPRWGSRRPPSRALPRCCSRRRTRPAATQSAARLSDSYDTPSSSAPSPNRPTATASPPWLLSAKPAPVARLMLPPTIAEVEMKPRSVSLMCIVPPAPRLMPFSRPRISASATFGSAAAGQHVAVVAVVGGDLVVRLRARPSAARPWPPARCRGGSGS